MDYADILQAECGAGCSSMKTADVCYFPNRSQGSRLHCPCKVGNSCLYASVSTDVDPITLTSVAMHRCTCICDNGCVSSEAYNAITRKVIWHYR